MFTIKAVKDNFRIRHVYAATRYSVYSKGNHYEVVIEEPGMAEGTCLFVSRQRGYEHLIIENAAGRNIEHLRASDFSEGTDDEKHSGGAQQAA